ncbi:MAG: Uma2 family endonuclease, partial [Gemmatimonas sp.]
LLAHAGAPSVRFVHHAGLRDSSMAHAALADVMLMTPEEFLVYPLENVKAELVRGELRVSPPGGAPHGSAGARLIVMLAAHVDPRKLGRVFGDGIGYQLLQLPRTVRVPDASFVRADQLPPEGIRAGLFKFAPAIAIEVLSPSETASELQEKLDDYRVAGTALVWVVDPVKRTVMVVGRDAPLTVLREGERLSGGEVLPEFSCAVEEIFEGIARDLRE